MELPEINDIITTERALELCRHFGLDYLISRIESNPDQFKAWKFDGCSCLPDQFLGLFTGCDWRDITYKCCLPHDLCYAYGEPGNHAERKRVDTRFFSDLVNKAGMKRWMARAFLTGVRVGGPEAFGLSFSWGFARKKRPKPSHVDS
ncbi:MAG: hypothetical protein U5R49_03955 [Deltaproteobacteria bacterium]|nr:hypothetical protein [Deltaproteobacteria bacterium]